MRTGKHCWSLGKFLRVHWRVFSFLWCGGCARKWLDLTKKSCANSPVCERLLKRKGYVSAHQQAQIFWSELLCEVELCLQKSNARYSIAVGGTKPVQPLFWMCTNTASSPKKLHFFRQFVNVSPLIFPGGDLFMKLRLPPDQRNHNVQLCVEYAQPLILLLTHKNTPQRISVDSANL